MRYFKTNVDWDTSLRDLSFTSVIASMPTGFQGLVIECLKITTGAPTATVGKFAKGAKCYNIFDGTWYKMTGTTAAPAWTLV